MLFWLAPSHKTLRVELNTLNLALGGISVLQKTKYSIASGGLCPPDPLLQRSTTVFSPPSQKILDRPLYNMLAYVRINTHNSELQGQQWAGNTLNILYIRLRKCFHIALICAFIR